MPDGSRYGTPWAVGPWTGSEHELWQPLLDGEFVKLKSAHDGLCEHTGRGAASPVGGGDCAWQDGWTFVRQSIGYQLVDRRYGGCLTAANGAAVTSACSSVGNPDDVWLPVWEHRGTSDPKLPGTVTLRLNTDPQQVAVVGGASTANGARLIQWPVQDQPHYKWKPRVYQAGAYAFENVNSGLCMNVAGGGSANGAAIVQFTCGSFANSQWTFNAKGSGYQLVGVQGGSCVNVSGGTGAGNWIIQFACQPLGAPNDTWLAVWEPLG
ncbi:RICIN domain-containing protein [Catellatospora methionotrophica]|uniref:RICIN domain-containing protein n=1 Tax=Catellatospora methionotrophica TaxID=121620 RepID=UPI00140CAE54|nr:RICIN domain-containing protein [Catellatospora methionotrophica]